MSNNVALRIVQPYAEALIELANTSNEITVITKDLLTVSEILSHSKPLKLFLANPIINIKSKKVVLNQVLKTQTNNTILKFLYVLIDKNKIVLFDIILARYLELSHQLESIITAHLSTPIALTNEQQNLLKNTIKQITQAKTIRIETQIDSTLIGGFKLRIKSKIIDTSIFGQLQKMASHLNASNILV